MPSVDARWLVASALAGALAACTSQGSTTTSDAGPIEAGAEAGSPCTTSDSCDPSDCACNDGTARQAAGACAGGACMLAPAACAPVCAQNGGVRTAMPAPNVVGSAECTAFCEKALSLGCEAGTSCRPYFNCRVSTGQCPTSVRAELTCDVEGGTWSCDSFGDWAVASGCTGAFTSRCQDGGSDAGVE
jgi:hypothetical protein